MERVNEADDAFVGTLTQSTTTEPAEAGPVGIGAFVGRAEITVVEGMSPADYEREIERLNQEIERLRRQIERGE